VKGKRTERSKNPPMQAYILPLPPSFDLPMEVTMPKFEVVFERSAVENRRLVIEADNQGEAERLATEELERQGPLADPAIKEDTTAFFGDEESVWEMVELEELK